MADVEEAQIDQPPCQAESRRQGNARMWSIVVNGEGYVGTDDDEGNDEDEEDDVVVWCGAEGWFGDDEDDDEEVSEDAG